MGGGDFLGKKLLNNRCVKACNLRFSRMVEWLDVKRKTLCHWIICYSYTRPRSFIARTHHAKNINSQLLEDGWSHLSVFAGVSGQPLSKTNRGSATFLVTDRVNHILSYRQPFLVQYASIAQHQVLLDSIFSILLNSARTKRVASFTSQSS